MGGTPGKLNFGSDSTLDQVPFTAIDVFQADDPSIHLNRPPEQQYVPQLGIDNDLSTWTAATPSGNVPPVIIGLDLNGLHTVNRFRVAKSDALLGGSDIDGTGDNNDFVDLEIPTRPIPVRSASEPITASPAWSTAIKARS